MKVDLTFPAAAAASLPSLIPPDVAGRLAAAGIDPAGIAAAAVAGNFPSGVLFSLDDGPKQIRVWLA